MSSRGWRLVGINNPAEAAPGHITIISRSFSTGQLLSANLLRSAIELQLPDRHAVANITKMLIGTPPFQRATLKAAMRREAYRQKSTEERAQACVARLTD
jgi:hypothetical protein